MQHYKIFRGGKGKYFLWSKKFRSINELLENHKMYSVSKSEFIVLTEYPGAEVNLFFVLVSYINIIHCICF